MNVFYNRDGIGDVLLVSLKSLDAEKRAIEKKGDVVRIFDETTNETAGYNLYKLQ